MIKVHINKFTIHVLWRHSKRESNLTPYFLELVQTAENIVWHARNIYSQTCEHMLPKEESDFGLYRQVVFIWSFLFYLIKEGLSDCVLYLQDGLYSEMIFNTVSTVQYTFYMYIKCVYTMDGTLIFSLYLIKQKIWDFTYIT